MWLHAAPRRRRCDPSLRTLRKGCERMSQQQLHRSEAGLCGSSRARSWLGKAHFNANSASQARLSIRPFRAKTTASLATPSSPREGRNQRSRRSRHPRLSQSLFANAVRTPSRVKPARAAVHCNEKSARRPRRARNCAPRPRWPSAAWSAMPPNSGQGRRVRLRAR